METDKPAAEILTEFANNSNRKIEHYRKDYPVSKIKPRFFYRSYARINSNTNDKVSFICYGDSKAFGNTAFFSGLFFPISTSSSTRIGIRQKNILDKLNPFLEKSSYKSRFPNFTSKVIITENDIHFTNKILDNERIQSLIIKALALDGRIRVGVNNIDINAIQDVNGKVKASKNSYFEIYIIGEWLLDASIIEQLFAITEELSAIIR